jgi:D-3-phosphoglycerate dehydrogenase
MFKYYCLNNIATEGLRKFSALYERTEDMDQADGILVRSAKMHDMEFSDNLLAIARAGAGVNNTLQRLALMRSIALHGGYQVRYKI